MSNIRDPGPGTFREANGTYLFDFFRTVDRLVWDFLGTNNVGLPSQGKLNSLKIKMKTHFHYI